MQYQSHTQVSASLITPSSFPPDGMEDAWMRELASRPRKARARAGLDLRMQMMAFIRGTQNNEHPCRLAARLDAIITLTQTVCTRPPCSRDTLRLRDTSPGDGPRNVVLNPAIARVLRNLDAVRNMLEGMESPQPGLRHALDPLLVAFLRGEFVRSR